MLRIAFGLAIVALIFAHSPERPTAASGGTSRWLSLTQADVTEAAFRSSLGQELLRRSLAPEDKAIASPTR